MRDVTEPMRNTQEVFSLTNDELSQVLDISLFEVYRFRKVKKFNLFYSKVRRVFTLNLMANAFQGLPPEVLDVHEIQSGGESLLSLLSKKPMNTILLKEIAQDLREKTQ